MRIASLPNGRRQGAHVYRLFALWELLAAHTIQRAPQSVALPHRICRHHELLFLKLSGKRCVMSACATEGRSALVNSWEGGHGAAEGAEQLRAKGEREAAHNAAMLVGKAFFM